MSKPKNSHGERDMEEAPEDLHCPILLEVMTDPVMLVQSGNTYERQPLLRALAARPGRDPLTNQEFRGRAIVAPNYAIKRMVVQWREKHEKSSPRKSTDPNIAPQEHIGTPVMLVDTTVPVSPQHHQRDSEDAPPRRQQENSLVDLFAAAQEQLQPRPLPPQGLHIPRSRPRPAVVPNQPENATGDQPLVTAALAEHVQAQAGTDQLRPRDHDVLFGRGRAVASHPGNIQLRTTILRFRRSYQQGTNYRHKKQIVEQVIQELRNEDVRFLRPAFNYAGAGNVAGSSYRDRNFEIATPIEVYRKVSHMLRDYQQPTRRDPATGLSAGPS